METLASLILQDGHLYFYVCSVFKNAVFTL